MVTFLCFQKFLFVSLNNFLILLNFFEEVLDIRLSTFYSLAIKIKDANEVLSLFIIIFHVSKSMS
jgi:hypothetical protein